jgi:hypothetical protein
MKTVKLALAATLFAAAGAVAIAQDVGTTIYGNDGNPIGTVEQKNDSVIVINTGKHKAPVPVSLIFESETGPAVNATKDQVDAMMDEQVAEAACQARCRAGRRCGSGLDQRQSGGHLTKVDLAADVIILDSPEGPIVLKKEHFAVNPQGQLMALVTREQIAAAARPVPQGRGRRAVSALSQGPQACFCRCGLMIFASVEAIVLREALRRHPSGSAARDLPHADFGLGAGALARSAHLPAKPVGEHEGGRIRHPAIAVTLQLHPLPAGHHGQFLKVEHHQLAVVADASDMIVPLGESSGSPAAPRRP